MGANPYAFSLIAAALLTDRCHRKRDHVLRDDQLTNTGGGGREEKMEGNRDEAEKCIHIATKALEAGDKEKALRFLNKAEKLYPTDRAKGGDVSY